MRERSKYETENRGHGRTFMNNKKGEREYIEKNE